MSEETPHTETRFRVSPAALLAGWALCTLALFPLFFAASWAGGEVAKFQVTTFESAARQALAAKDFDAALKYCNGAVKAGHGTSDHWGRVYTLRSVAYLGQQDLVRAANEVLRAGDFFTRRYYVAAEQDQREVPQLAKAIGLRLLQEGDAALAQAVFSAGAMASGDPVAALHGLARELAPEDAAKLWGEGEPRILITTALEEKDALPRVIVNDQAREIRPRHAGSGITEVEAGASAKEGPCWVAVLTHVPLSRRPFAIRARAQAAKLSETKLMLSYWFESPRKSANTMDPPSGVGEDGWSVYDVRRDFFAERAAEAMASGYTAEGGIINQVVFSLPPGEADVLRYAPVELYLPRG